MNDASKPDFQSWVARVAWISLVGLVAGGAGWSGWMTNSIFVLNANVQARFATLSTDIQERLTAPEVVEIVNTQAPYIRDKRLIDEALAASREINKELKDVNRQQHTSHYQTRGGTHFSR